ncbi:MAG: GNAT family N-acetyltransferase [Alphaproteobacteria bacterium]
MTECRTITQDELDWLTELNNACIPGVNEMTADGLWDIVEKAAYAKILWDNIGEGPQPLGALTVLTPGVTHWSTYYAWCGERFDDFYYVDRIIVSEAARGRKVGERMYRDLFGFVEGRTTRVLCEVNTIPANPGSMRFHERLGFRPIDRLGDATKEVQFYEYLLP